MGLSYDQCDVITVFTLNVTKMYILLKNATLITKIILFLNVFLLINCSPISSPPILIVISFDGFRYDYVSPESTPTLYKLRTNGVSGK